MQLLWLESVGAFGFLVRPLVFKTAFEKDNVPISSP